ncbi:MULTISPECIES: DUF397 domain-containing protein [Streptomyces]|uniref:DUF397 domain-containing protein n=1 Tax=Streptomyces clavifer TaxID=68188 RepID=A0ABS4VBK7_9ACTN|nr:MULTISPECIES: DUF397 domain-containing protein [Streptomyces]KQX78945.1 hypothetical protein ASD26_10625 [Streptomyces sp. Root1319]KQZ03710.1 hypothetical protein ASD51_17905 [Streptomyces sp. Root55]MBP2361304.1 hypothetical protein [Streptomyces clavifer]MDX2744311.1 DUF397 domain-containing protein [Streptomyces sp. NRRL_B-2557]MDX3067535.1 DUF397 domain-containing protein [Streptomyces sp. ND04-05B]
MDNSKQTVSDSSTLTGWFKSSYSGGGQGECLEVSDSYVGVPVRDSKAPTGPAVVFSAGGWASFVSAVKGGFTV